MSLTVLSLVSRLFDGPVVPIGEYDWGRVIACIVMSVALLAAGFVMFVNRKAP